MARKKIPSKTVTGNIEIKSEDESLQALFGFNKVRYEQKTAEEYRNYLERLNLADFQRHAVEHGIVPSAVSRSVLIARLVNQFSKNKISHIDKRNVNPVDVKSTDKEVLDFLARGR